MYCHEAPPDMTPLTQHCESFRSGVSGWVLDDFKLRHCLATEGRTPAEERRGCRVWYVACNLPGLGSDPLCATADAKSTYLDDVLVRTSMW
jgi:hypothetical protein